MGVAKAIAGNIKSGFSGVGDVFKGLAKKPVELIKKAAPEDVDETEAAEGEGAEKNNRWSKLISDSLKGLNQDEEPMMPVQMQNQGIVQRQNPGFEINPFLRQHVPFGGYRRSGGRVEDDEAYVVGEDGPELIVPEKDGMVVPNEILRSIQAAGQLETTNPVPLGGRNFRDKLPFEEPGPVPLGGNRPQQPFATPGPVPLGGGRGAAVSAPTTSEEMLNIPMDGQQKAQAAPQAGIESMIGLAGDERQETGGGSEVTDPRQRLMRRPSDKTFQEIDKTYEKGTTPKTSLKDRLFSGIAKGSRGWDGTGGIFGWLFSVLGGGVGSAASEGYYDDISRSDKRNRLMRQAGVEMKKEEFDSKIANTEADNFARDARNKVLEDQGAAKIATTRLKNFTDRIWKNQKYFDPSKASELDRKELAGLGLTPEAIGKFDFRDPKTKTVNGVTFQWDRDSQSFKESNLPADGSEATVEYTVTDPEGVPHKFKVRSEKAAAFLTSIKAAGMQIDSRERMQENQQRHDIRKTQIMSELRLKYLEREKLLADNNNAASQQRAAEIEKEMLRLRQEQKSLEE